MAAETITTLQYRLIQAYSPMVVETFARRVETSRASRHFGSFFEYLQAVGAVKFGQMDLVGGAGGKEAARWIAEIATGNTITPFVSGDARPAGGARTDIPAYLSWAGLWGTAAMSGDAYRASTANAMWTNADGWAEKTEQLIADIIDQLDTYLCADGTTSNAPEGIKSAIGIDTNTYAAIDRTVQATWKPALVDLSSSDVTKADLDGLHRTMVETRRARYDRIICGPTQFQKLGNILDGRRRDASDIAVTDLQYNGRPIHEIPGLPQEQIFFVKDSHWCLTFRQFKNGVLNGAIQQASVEVGLPFGMMVSDDGSDGAVLTMAIEPQLIYKNPWDAGCLDNCGV